MAYSYVAYAGDGSSNSWTIPFAYLDDTHVHLYIDGVEDTTFTFLTASSIAATSTPAFGAVVLVTRETPHNALVVEIPVSGTLKGTDLNDQAWQALYVAEEALDQLTGTIGLTGDGLGWDATSKPIKNVSDPTDAQDAATKAWVDSTYSSSVSAAASSASAAASSASAAATSASNASSSASAASASETAAAASETAAAASETAAAASETAAAASETAAASSASAASASAANASGSETAAASSASAASTSASNAAASEAAAATTYDNFDDRYLGQKASDPTLDNDGAALLTGALYFNTTVNHMKVYTGTVWNDFVADAETAETNAASSASAASTSASNAATSETNAGTSETNAAASASTASTQAGIATTQAGNAATSASAASTSAGNAATSETNAASSASAASTSATNASNSASAAGTAQTAAEAAQAATENIFAQFGDEYLGPFATDPTLDNSGNPLTQGDIYWNTANNTLRFYNGTAWVAPETIATTAATNAQTSETNAANSASAASTSASNAATSETNAANSASAASTSASNASTSATNASNSASAASTSASNAATSEANAATSYDNFDDRFLGPKATDPTLDNDGNALLTGAIYWNTATNRMKFYTGTVWSDPVTAAATSETNAASSASAASTSASSASTSATNASNSASAASTSASNAATSETNASNSASAASTSASNASTSATNASNSASAASTSASNAATSETNAAATYDLFDDRMLGAKASDPTLDNDGNALVTGTLYWNTTSSKLRIYNGSAFEDAAVPASGAVVATGTPVDNQIGVWTNATTIEGDANFTWNAATSIFNVGGSITLTGTVDGRDIATDGSKLDGIEAGATADQTAGEIEAIVNHDNLLGYVANQHINWTSATSSLSTSGNVTSTGNFVSSKDRTTSPILMRLINTTPSGEFRFNYKYTGGANQIGFADSADAWMFYVQYGATNTHSYNFPGTGDATFGGNIVVGGAVDGRDVATDGSKLDGIEALADVTDATNVAAAGAIMDSDIAPASGILKKTGAGTYTAITDNSASWDTAYGWGDHAGLYSLTSHNHTLDSLSNVTITTIASGELLKWSGTAWINNTLAEAGVSAVGHTHVIANITDFTDNSTNWNTAYGWGNHASAGYITGITAIPLSDHSDVTITTIAAGELLKWSGTAWINNTLAEAGIAAASHTHAWSDITSGTPTTLAGYGITDAASSSHNHTLDSLSNVTITANSAGELLSWNGSAWINQTIAELGISAGCAVQATPPVSPNNGDLWYDTDSGGVYVYVNDGDSSQWAESFALSQLPSTVYQVAGTDVAVADGGTGASTIADAKTNLEIRELTYHDTGVNISTGSPTAVAWSGVPSWVSRITILFYAMSTNGTNHVGIQIGDSGGLVTTSTYLGSCTQADGTNVANNAMYYICCNNTAASVWYGVVELYRYHSSNHTWFIKGNLSSGTASRYCTGALPGMTGSLTQFRLITNGGSDTFDGGFVNVMYD